MAKILVVEDDRELAGVIEDWLKADNHSVDVAHDGRDASYRMRQYQYDLAILDWELPEMSGVEVCKKYRAGSGTMPVIMLTGRKATEDKISGLDAGADDYLTKPFELGELSARVRALLRRPSQFTGGTLKVRNLTLESETFRVTIDDKEVYLLPKEFALLEFLMRHPGQVFSSEALIERVWPSDSEASPDTVRTHLTRLRKKLDQEGQPPLFRTVHGMGYKLDA